jgi:hypothetical protein
VLRQAQSLPTPVEPEEELLSLETDSGELVLF